VEAYFENPIIIEIKSGEKNKKLSTCSFIWEQMTEHQLDRKALMVNLGGGVIGDMGGFCASTYKRGLDFIQIPTTLLSQVDASVGGKLGIDFNSFKNHIGLFRIPNNVFINTTFLNTLPKRELRSGYAEVIKHCLIADLNKWNEIKDLDFENNDWNEVTTHSVGIKNYVTHEDPTEKGLRKILNFGHTVGHAIESFYLNTPKRLLHGEAVAVGMICEAFISKKRGFISDSELETLKDDIIKIYDHPIIEESDLDSIVPLAYQDKKNEKNIIKSTLLEKIGTANFDNPISEEDIKESILYYNS
jgi:3-dehydroquinate synthase